MFGLVMRSRELDFYLKPPQVAYTVHATLRPARGPSGLSRVPLFVFGAGRRRPSHTEAAHSNICAPRYRFAITAGISSIVTCLSYVGIIKAKLPESMHEGFHWRVATFYICAALAMVLSLYNLVVTSFYMVQGQGLALHGAPGSLIRAVGIFEDQWPIVRLTLVGSLLSIVLASTSISWMKLDGHSGCMEASGSCECEGVPASSCLPLPTRVLPPRQPPLVRVCMRHHAASAQATP